MKKTSKKKPQAVNRWRSGQPVTRLNVYDWLKQEKAKEERRRSRGSASVPLDLPPDHPDHTCGLCCDGQDGRSSDCARIRRALGYQ